MNEMAEVYQEPRSESYLRRRDQRRRSQGSLNGANLTFSNYFSHFVPHGSLYHLDGGDQISDSIRKTQLRKKAPNYGCRSFLLSKGIHGGLQLRVVWSVGDLGWSNSFIKALWP